ncbi:MAG: carboxymuconolactone decarboxylase family protein, partial [Pseudomonadota bacterium]|nr:carboxymuconolactone decarboxylase family protein [Pseudomonadota bacterium]
MRTLAATAAFASALAAAPEGHAQSSGAGGRIAPQAVYEVSPPLGAYTDAQLFGRVWADPTLAPRDRSLVTVAALIAGGRIAQVGSHSGRALDNGVTPEELGEVLAHLAFYAGWPVAISAVFEIREVFDARGIAAVDPETGDLLELDPEAEAARRAAVAANAAPFAPGLAGATDDVLFADLWRRPGLAPRDRSLVTVAALIAVGQAEQAPFHLNRAMDNGLTRDEAAELVHHAAYYAGCPRAFSAVGALKTVFEAREAA